MKRFLLLATFVCAMLFVACDKYDDSKIWDNIELTYIPRHSDGKAIVIYSTKADSYVELDFKVSPTSETANWRANATVKAIYTQTRAGVEFVDMEILDWSEDSSKGTITVKASGENLSDDFFAGEQEASAQLSITTNGGQFTSDDIPMVAIHTQSKNEIWYTSTDGKIVTPFATIYDITESTKSLTDGEIVRSDKTNVFGANIVSNTYENGLGIIKFDGEVTAIGKRAFYSCSSLTSITIPDSVTAIGHEAFYNCSSLKEVYCKPTTPPNMESAFEYNATGCKIYVPENSIDAYKAADSWNIYASAVVADPATIAKPVKNEIWYTSTDGEIVTPYNTGAFGANIISNTYENGKGIIKFDGNVTTIGDHAFAECNSLTNITIPNNVKTIEKYAFNLCSSLTNITIPNSVKTIGASAFTGCSSLTNITIPNSVKTIGDHAFNSCTSLTNITIPNSVKTIDSGAFNCCSNLTAFYGKFASDDNRCLIVDGVFNSFAPAGITSYTIPDSVTTIGSYAFNDCYSLTNITIPNSVTTIGDYAFYGCNSLTNITIPNSVTTIGKSAFQYCSNLTNITIPNSVTTIGKYAFETCASLTNITIPNSVTTIGDSAFAWCISLTNITIPNSVKTIGKSAFSCCNSLTSVTIPNSVTTIGDFAFSKCSGLTNITIPNSVTTIGWHAFNSCSSLTNITIPNSVTTIENGAFRGCSNLTAFYGKFASDDNRCLIVDGVFKSFAPAGITSYAIPDSVTTIGGYAFSDCSSLTNITIPDSVTTIENAFFYCRGLTKAVIGSGVKKIYYSAFANCNFLNEVICKPTTPPTGDSSMFKSIGTSAKIYVPIGSGNAYKTASYWSAYASMIEEKDF